MAFSSAVSRSSDDLQQTEDSGRLDILVVDDNPGDAELVRACLLSEEYLGAEPLIACSADEALQLVSVHAFDCILIDYQMPAMNGLELLRRLRAQKNCRLTPVIMLTGCGNEAVVIEAMHAGAADYVAKSDMSARVIARAVENAVEKARLRMTIERESRHLEAANVELQRRHAEIQHVYHMISHEIKTPLTAAREFASLVLDELVGPVNEKQRECLRHIAESCDQLASHFDDLLDFARANVGKLSMRPETCELAPLVRRAVASVAREAREKNIRIQRTLASSLPPIQADPRRIVQVIGNLLSNAVKFSDEGGRVSLGVTPVNSPLPGVQIDVSDNGCGIAQDDLAHIFESPFQAIKNDYTTDSGLGLGLSIARNITQLHGGDITVESRPGIGSTFSVFLPCSPADGNATGRFALAIAQGD